VCVIGLGLIGGSLLRAARRSGRTAWGATLSTADAQAATLDGYRVEDTVDTALAEALRQNAIVVIAVPLPAVDGVLERVAAVAPGCLLSDVVSVKAPVVDSVRRIAPRTRYAGGHPMAGAAESGWSAGTAMLFDGAAWVVTVEEDTDPAAWRAAAELAIDCGAHVVPAGATEHDMAVARVSHLPHVLAAVLAATGAEGGPLAMALAAGSFADGTRVAGTRADLVLAMCEGNREQLLAAVDDALGKLGAARGALASTGSLRATVAAGNLGRAALIRQRTTTRTERRIDLAAPNALGELRGLGAQNGRVIGFDGESAIVELPVL
jgi:prephenate dehydrogenase